jgi:PTH1 family peptidyl-tRNA hydrolase
MAELDGWVVMGLGNPGEKYSATRHNVGYAVADELRARMGGNWKSHKAGRVYAVEGRLAGSPGVRTILGRARSYMNDSGAPAAGLLGFYRLPAEKLVVVHDELDLPFGNLRVKFGGGDNGHNGLKSLRRSLGTGDYFRVRFGVGRPPGRMDPAAFVLRDFSAAERKDLDLEIDRCADATEMLVREGLEKTQNTFNS